MQKPNSLASFRERCTQLPRNEKGCWLWDGFFASNRYGYYRLWGRVRLAHRVSFTAFRMDIPDDWCVLHRCDEPKCVNPDHLFIGTQLENIQDRVTKKRSATGERCGRAKLTEQKVLQIRSLYATNRYTTDQLGKRFGVSNHQISQVVNKKSWSHL